MVAQAKVLYLEGYLWDSDEAKRAFIAAAEVARAHGAEVALSLSDAFCVERHRDSFQELVDGHVDIHKKSLCYPLWSHSGGNSVN